jgi:hypothetical protein
MALASAPFPAFAATGNIIAIGRHSPITLDLSSNCSAASEYSETGWAWDAATDTLTLDSDYSGTNNPISITAAPGDTITLKLAGDVKIGSGSDGIYVDGGSLAVTADSGSNTLAIDSYNYALYADGDIAIESGTVDATSQHLIAIASSGGDILIKGSSNVAANGISDVGIAALSGNVGISTSGTVTAAGHSDGIVAYGGVAISGGTVTARGTTYAGISAYTGDIDISGGTVDATGGNSEGGYALRALSGSVSISGGTVTAHAGAAGYSSPAPIVTSPGTYSEATATTPPTPGSGSGGCDAGFGAGALLAAAGILAAGKKRRGR